MTLVLKQIFFIYMWLQKKLSNDKSDNFFLNKNLSGQDERRLCAVEEDFEAIKLTSDSSFLINFYSNTESPHGKGFLLLYDGVGQWSQ